MNDFCPASLETRKLLALRGKVQLRNGEILLQIGTGVSTPSEICFPRPRIPTVGGDTSKSDLKSNFVSKFPKIKVLTI